MIFDRAASVEISNLFLEFKTLVLRNGPFQNFSVTEEQITQNFQEQKFSPKFKISKAREENVWISKAIVWKTEEKSGISDTVYKKYREFHWNFGPPLGIKKYFWG